MGDGVGTAGRCTVIAGRWRGQASACWWQRSVSAALAVA